MTDASIVPAPRRYEWSRLNRLYVGRFGEYFVKMEFTLRGFDVHGAAVDDKGIGFVIRKAVDNFYDVQVKTARLPGGNYVYFAKDGFALQRSMIAALVLLRERAPPDSSSLADPAPRGSRRNTPPVARAGTRRIKGLEQSGCHAA